MSKPKEVTIVTVRDGIARVETVRNDLPVFQEIVGGLIACVGIDAPPGLRPIDLWCDEEFLFKEGRALPRELAFNESWGGCRIAGDFYLASVDCDGNTVSLLPDQIEWIQRRLLASGITVFRGAGVAHRRPSERAE